jgi:hypothetical protein
MPSAHVGPVSGSRAKLGAREEVLQRAHGTLNQPLRGPEPERWAIRYLESSRSLPPTISAPVPPPEQVKLAEAQADRIVGAITSVLDSLGLSAGDRERGRKLAAGALRAVAVEGWSPL